MARVKFLVFALAVIGLWLAHLYLLTPALIERAVGHARSQAASAPTAVALRIHERQVKLQQAVIKAAGSASIAQAARSIGRPDPAPERFAPIKSEIADALPASMRSGVVIGVVSESGSIYARGDAEATTSTDALDLPKLASAGGQGVVQEAFGSNYLFHSAPVLVSAGGEPKAAATLVIGAPLIAEEAADAIAADLKLESVALFAGGKLVASGGPERDAAEKAEPQTPPGQAEVVARGKVSSLGPIGLPFLSTGDVLGGAAPLKVAARQAVAATPFEVIAVAAVPLLQPLADYQKTAVFGFAGLLVLTVVFALLIGSARAPASAPAPQPAAVAAAPEPRLTPPPRPTFEPELAPPLEPAFDPAPPEFAQFDAPPPPQPLFSEADAAPPAFEPAPSDAMPGGFSEPPPVPTDPDADGDATRVAAIPPELLQASARPMATEPGVPTTVAPSPLFSGPTDEEHFHEVFREFVATRERCGEPADGLTYEKFAVKLGKNRDQLMQKYNCRTVRFQVYVKEGKAALKATPIRE